MFNRFKQFIQDMTLKKKIESSMGLQLMITLSGVISVILLVGAILIARTLMPGQYRNLEERGRELGLFLGKAGTEPILLNDTAALDTLVAEALGSKDLVYLYIVDGTGRVMNSMQVSFSRSDPGIQSLLSAERSGGVAAAASKIRQEMDILPIQVPIQYEKTRVGAVMMGISRSAVKRDAWKLVMLLVGAGAVMMIVLSALVYWMVGRMVVLPTREAAVVASNIASGDLMQSVRVRSVDELGLLGRGLNRMIIGLKDMIGNVREAAHNMESIWDQVKSTAANITSGSRVQSESVEEAASSVNEMHFALKEIAANVDDLHASSEQTSSSVIELAASITEVAKTMSELSSTIEETSSAITEMSSAIGQIAENVETLSSAVEQTSASSLEITASVKEVESAARESASLAEAVAADAQDLGMRAIEKTIEGMGRIDSNARRTAEVINRLGGRAESIGGILTVIEDITDQTGLLALNAAILAAQAGEHGKGFAVVAAEIRELANRTAVSTQEIGKLIASVQEESRQAVEVMQEGDVIVKEGVNLATNAGKALRRILEQAGTSRDMSRGISRAAAEQARGIKQVSEAVQQINKMAHQFAHAANEQKTGSEQIMRAAEKMREITLFVSNSAQEQAKAGKDITASVEHMNSKIAMVNRATEEVRAGSDLIVKAIERIKEIAKSNVGSAAGLGEAMDLMSRQSSMLNKEIEKFRM